MTLCFQGPWYWVLKGSRALTIRSLEAWGNRTLHGAICFVKVLRKGKPEFEMLLLVVWGKGFLQALGIKAVDQPDEAPNPKLAHVPLQSSW